ncbi:TonB-dependent siderophore receptor [Empedobacter sp. UBA7494]|uniref:TonB-dependent siderophore receptor n=1 Tax=Empedobacter sp. UBA7494 TaxID=1946450 RepID=UPI0025BB5261|nr:TonB-dependent receptor [Empedobacter sp. UBA7494]
MKRNKLLLATLTILSFSTAFAQETTKEKKDSINNLQEVEIFGDRNKKQRGLEAITRFPVSPNQQIQTISTISEKLIEEQGALTITDAARNVPGVTLFGSYGGNRESMSIRGYRGTPVLRNGVRQDSDFRTAGAIADMQGIESIQVIKGSAAITQGVGNSLGSAGGVINLATKTPRFINAGNIGLRVGSWNQVRTTFDVQRVVDNAKSFAFRLNGAYQQGDSYRDVVNNKRFYIQPSLAWRPDDKTEVIAEMDYLNFEGVPDAGTVNLNNDFTQALANMGHRFLGFDTDFDKSEATTYSLRATRQLTDKISVRAAYYGSINDRDQQSTSLATIKDKAGNVADYSLRTRSLGHSTRNDRNTTIQIDVMGKDFQAGILKWSWQAGYDYTTYRVDSRSAQIDSGKKDKDGNPIMTSTIPVVEDPINVLQNINNKLPNNFDFSQLTINTSSPLDNGYYYGFMTQHHLNITDYVKVVGALRWSYSGVNSKDILDPMIGLMVSPIKNINLFGSYTTTSSLRSASNPLQGGGTVGTSRTKQFETGIKTDWFNDRLRANVTYFDMVNENLAYEIVNGNTRTGLYQLAGDLKRKGIELEVTGRPLPNVQVMLGYSYLDTQYQGSPSYVDGSRPMNAPRNTANAWVQYKFQKTNTFIDGLSISSGLYYVGSRPVNDRSTTKDAHGNVMNGQAPFLMPEYTTLNAQIGYSTRKFDFRLFFNNITDEIGYNSYYRGGYINQIDPFNMAGQVVFKF